METYKVVLKAILHEIKNGRCYYRIEGDNDWKELFSTQKAEYISNHIQGNILYSVPSSWYYGLECPLCLNPHNNKIFFNINDHERAASILAQLDNDYWVTLAEKSGDKNWLLRSRKTTS